MGYMSWTGSTAPEDKTGEAFIIVESQSMTLRLPDFKTAMQLDRLMELAFEQGKQFATRAMRSHVERALDDAVRAHTLFVSDRGTEGGKSNG